MAKKLEHSARDYLPEVLTLPALQAASKKCRGCDLYKNATQTVFGSGPKDARLMMVGEIPGDVEDKLGEPFTGPAGRFLRKTIAAIGLDEEDIYFTNVVKHFKFVYMNHRRMHRTPLGREIKACMPWLEVELKVIHPQVIMCLGVVAAKALIAKDFRVREQRGQWIDIGADTKAIATFHPSAILRAPDPDARHEMQEMFLQDMKKVAEYLG